MKKTLLILTFYLYTIGIVLSQPQPGDRGPGGPGGDPSGDPNLGGGAPLDDFIIAFIILPLLYVIYKFIQNRNTLLIQNESDN